MPSATGTRAARSQPSASRRFDPSSSHRDHPARGRSDDHRGAEPRQVQAPATRSRQSRSICFTSGHCSAQIAR
jgi:hypothetical protein